MTRARSIIVAALVVGLAISCTNPMRDTLEAVVQQFSTAGYTSNLHEDSPAVDKDMPLIFTFNESMDPDTLTIDGTLSASDDGGVWSTDEFPNDTLTISPTSSWPIGDNRTLSVEVADLQTYPSAPIDLTLGVIEGVVYVSSTVGNDGNPGTPTQPKRTIQAGIVLSEFLYDGGEVRVAEGEYTPLSSILISEGVQLRGGYSAGDWNVRDDLDWALLENALYPTTVQYSVPTAVQINENTQGFLVEGFTIEKISSGAGSQQLYVGIDVDSANGTVRSCSIDGGYQATVFSAALMMNGAEVVVDRCDLYGGELTPTSYGILANASELEVLDSVVHAGSGNYLGDSTTKGIAVTGTTSTIERSHINGGGGNFESFAFRSTMSSDATVINSIIQGGTVSQGFYVYGVYARDSLLTARNCVISGGSSAFGDSMDFGAVSLDGDTTASLDNNIIFTGPVSGAPFRRTGVEAVTECYVMSLKNNSIYDCPDGLFVWVKDPREKFLNIDDVNDLTFASGNVNLAADFENVGADDYHLQNTTDVNIRQGGIDGAAASWGYDTDRDGVYRTNLIDLPNNGPSNTNASGWSMGAYENDFDG